jgi:hypothetical protein
MRQPETRIDLNVSHHASRQGNNHSFYETGQLRRAKMHVARLIDVIDDKKVLSPALYQLLEASLILETTDTGKLAAYLKKPPAMIHAELRRIHAILRTYQAMPGDF